MSRFKLLFFFVLSFLFLVLPIKAYADDDFDISTVATYNIQPDGNTRITQDISIKNKKEFVYTPSYTISIGFKNIGNIKTYNADGSIENVVKNNNDGATIEVNFPKRVVGAGNVNKFTVSFDTDEIAKRLGSIWEVNIPGLSSPDSFSSYTINVIVPPSFGLPNIIKPYKKFANGQSYSFNKNEIGEGGIFLLFGDAQYYTFNLSYHIANDKIIPVRTEIALPPMTDYQDVRIKSLDPKPIDVYQDKDGNWLAIYNLNPKERKDIQATVIVKVLSGPLINTSIPASGSIQSEKYWEVNNPNIQKLSADLKTPQQIYNYVVNTLNYNFDKVGDKNIRLGAAGVLKRPDFAVCLEFTDLFVTLARAVGIRARAVEGFAYTENEKLRPLSLSNDVLHSWPEYYDENLKTWIMVDPTWGNTTHGMDYFNTMDFDHVAFVIKGDSSTYPVPAGGYKIGEETKDVNMTFGGKQDFTNDLKTSVGLDLPSNALSGFPISGAVIIKNEGNMPTANKKLVVSSSLTPRYQEYNVGTILPYGKQEVPITFDKTPFLTMKTYQATIFFDGNQISKKINVGLFPDYYWLVVGGVIIFGSTIVAIATYKTWSIYLQKRRK
ncbi:MAG TPA: transglutaminase-like domain-containing protein [Patescibacteria group bacterium]|nr:transglutaminase-like domain-containing protein [Patescibacteria group bacterium]